jgi:hypothetical protein
LIILGAVVAVDAVVVAAVTVVVVVFDLAFVCLSEVPVFFVGFVRVFRLFSRFLFLSLSLLDTL